MSIEIRELTSDDRDQWDSYVEQSPYASLFHRYDALEVLSEHAEAPLHPLVGFKGQEPVGLFPVFEVSKGPLTAAFSPPPRLAVPFLGPALLNLGKLKQRKAERRHRRFVDGCLERVTEEIGPRYTKFGLGCAYDDIRPFKWNDYRLTPWYTYLLDLTGGPEIIERFSSDARRNIRDGDGVSFAIEEAGVEAAERIIRQVRRRHENQNRPFGPTAAYVADLYERLPEGTVRPYVCRVEGEFVGGIVALEDDDTVYRWQGGVRPETDTDLAVNDHLDWRVMRSAIDRGLAAYDLVGAGTPRINEYKAKFNPEVRTFFTVEHGTWPVTTLVSLYRRLA